MTTLYLLSDAYRLAVAELDDAEGEVSDELAVRLDAITDAIGVKIDACLALAAEAEREAESFAAEASRLVKLSKAAANRQESLRAYVLRSMLSANIPKLAGTRFKVAVSPGRERVVVDDVERLPESCRRVKVEPDKTVIRTLLDVGADVPGAHLETGPPSLRVR